MSDLNTNDIANILSKQSIKNRLKFELKTQEISNENIALGDFIINDSIDNKIRNVKEEFKNKLIESTINEWSTIVKKNHFSVTEVINCPLQVWLRRKGLITRNDIDIDKIFYLLNVYGIMGTSVHNYIYSIIKLNNTEKQLEDKSLNLVGKYDIIENNELIDIKSARKKTDCSKQLSLYLHLLKINGFNIKSAKIWWVLLDEYEPYDVGYLDALSKQMIKQIQYLNDCLNNNIVPTFLDYSSCQYCLVENMCKQKYRNKSTQTTNNNYSSEIIESIPVL